MTQLVTCFVIGTHELAALLGRDDYFHFLISGLLDYCVAIVASIGYQMSSLEPCDQSDCLLTICLATWGNNSTQGPP